jgi:hypothetical protein
MTGRGGSILCSLSLTVRRGKISGMLLQKNAIAVRAYARVWWVQCDVAVRTATEGSRRPMGRRRRRTARTFDDTLVSGRAGAKRGGGVARLVKLREAGAAIDTGSHASSV